jgi:hypothetical protein
MNLDTMSAAAMDVGRRQADATLALRDRALRIRAEALDAHRRLTELRVRVQRGGEQPTAEALVRTAGVLVAEGDSWFDYPLHDVLKILEDHHGYDVESVAHKGDPIEEMAYGGNQLEDLTRRLEKLLARGIVPRALLLSGGGNDVAGPEFGMLLNHAGSSIAGLNTDIVNGLINQRVRTAYITILSAVTSICEQKLGKKIPILLHGYDYPVPDGRGFLGDGGFFQALGWNPDFARRDTSISPNAWNWRMI